MKYKIMIIAAVLAAALGMPAKVSAQSKVCDTGTQWYSTALWMGYVVQLQPESPGHCRVLLISHSGDVHYSTVGDEGYIEFAAIGVDVNGDGRTDAVLEVRQGNKYRYAVLTPGAKPVMQAEFLTSDPLVWSDRDADGKIEISGYERVFVGMDGISRENSPHPLVVWRMHSSNTMVPLASELWPSYRAEINHAKEMIKSHQDAKRRLSDDELKALTLSVTLNYLYAGKEQDAWNFLKENTSEQDNERLKRLIMDNRRKGLLGEVARPAPQDVGMMTLPSTN